MRNHARKRRKIKRRRRDDRVDIEKQGKRKGRKRKKGEDK